MKKIFFFVVMIAIFYEIKSQTYTIFKTGANTWGGTYVPPIWSKTYNFSITPYQSPNLKTGNTGTTSSSYSGSPITRLSGYGKKNKWNFNSDPEGDDKRWKQKEETLKEAIDIHFVLLDSAIILFNEGYYQGSTAILDNLLYGLPKTKYDFGSFGNDLFIKYSEAIQEFMYIRYCYKYFCEVKLHNYGAALETYNMFLSSYQSSSNPYDKKKMYPLTPEFYFVLDTIDKTTDPGFNNISLQDRYKADLFLVETLAGLGKIAEANKIMEMTLKFYNPLFKNIDNYYAQIAVNFFYLNNADEAAKYLEYFCNINKSNNARMAIIEELLFNHKSTIMWNETNSPACYKIIEDNLLFLDELVRNGEKVDRLYFEKNWNELYVKRSKNLDKFEKKVELKEHDLEMISTGAYSRERLEAYLIALIKSGKEEVILKIMEKLAEGAEMQRKRQVETSEILNKETKQSNAKHIKDLEGYYLWSIENYDKELAKKKKSYATEQKISQKRWKESIEDAVEKYWINNYKVMADPFAVALAVFRLPGFAEAGGKKYLQKYATPYVEELSKYTEDEVSFNYTWTIDLEKCGILPKLKKSRSYPKKIE